MKTSFQLILAGVLSMLAFGLWVVTTDTPTQRPNLTNLSALQLETPETDTLHVVTRAIDGDTIEVDGGTKVRYIGIDAPEVYELAKASECFSKEASLHNEQLLLNKNVRLVRDVSETDKYDRLLRYVYLADTTSSISESTSINEMLVAEGFAVARAYPPDVALQERLDALERDARDQKLGLWKTCR